MVKQIEPISEALSPLESEILDVLWSQGESKVRDIFSKVKKRQACAQTSIAVTLDRLHQKGLVDRKITKGRGGLAYIYLPKVSKDQFRHNLMQKAVEGLVERFGESAISYFNEKYPKER